MDTGTQSHQAGDKEINLSKNSNSPEAWEKEFDKKFGEYLEPFDIAVAEIFNIKIKTKFSDLIKHYIKSLLTAVREKERNSRFDKEFERMVIINKRLCSKCNRVDFKKMFNTKGECKSCKQKRDLRNTHLRYAKHPEKHEERKRKMREYARQRKAMQKILNTNLKK